MTTSLVSASPLLAVSLLSEQRLFNVVSLLLHETALFMVLAWGWAIVRAVKGQPLLPPPFVRLGTATWGLGAIFTILFLYLVAGEAAAGLCRNMLGIRIEQSLKEMRGETKADVVAKPGEARPEASDPPGPAAKQAEDADAQPHRGTAEAARDLMLLNACHILLFLAAFPWIFRRCSGADLDSLGLTNRRWPAQILAGLATALIATPAVYVVQFMAVFFFTPESHPVEKMLKDQFSPGTAFLAVFSAVLLAPLAEETLFRGVLQGWLTRIFRRSQPDASPSTPPRPVQAADVDAAEESAFAPSEVDFATEEHGDFSGESNDVCWPAVVVASALFAALHSPQWPAPIPLFFFAMILGVVYQRTGSLLTAITAHAVFNGCSTLMMMAQQLGNDIHHVKEAAPAAAYGLPTLLGRVLEILT